MIKLTLPNALTASRIVSVPFLMLIAWQENHLAFIILLGAALLTDVFDGMLARKLNQAGPAGARLDSWADFCIYMSLPVCAWWLWPDIVRKEALFIVAVVASYILPIAYGSLKYGRMTSYHTRLAKISAVLMGPSILLMFSRITPWPFRLFTLFPVAACIEELSMTTLLPRWHANIPSFRQALAVKREQSADKKEPPTAPAS
jgi:phosphatidylglycerophosphate synthase